MWKPIVSVAATLSVAVLAFAGVTHLRHQRAEASPLAAASAPAAPAQQSGRVRSNFGALPLAFEANQGQTDPQVKYVARGSGYTVFLTPNDTVFALHSSTPASSAHAANVAERSRARLARKQANASISMKLAGANPQPQIAAQNELPGHSNYFIGRDPSQWQTGVKQYSRVSYRDVYPGVDMAFHGQQRQLEFDFIVAPGASAAPIGFDVSGAGKISTDADGNLVLASKAGNVLLHKPVAYQEKNNTREPVDAGFVVQANNEIGFTLGNYDRNRELVIDPSVTYATFLGGTQDDEAYGIAFDSSGAAYVTGETNSTNFPTSTGAPYKTQGGIDAFVSKISADGSTLEYSTYVGGTGSDGGNAIAVDGSGNAYVAGATNSGAGANFPITAGAAQTTPQGGFDAFVLELKSDGSGLMFCTYLGGNGDDFAHGVAVDTSGVYVVGATASTNFTAKTTTNGFQSTISGTSSGFITKLSTDGKTFIYSSYLGGGTGDFASAVAVASNQAYVTGGTLNASGNFPLQTPLQPLCSGTSSGCSGVYDAFVTVVDSTGTGLVYSTFLGGTGSDQGLGIAVDGSGDAYVTGSTQSKTNFPLVSALQGAFGSASLQAFVSEINPGGTALVYSTYLGGSVSQTGTGIAVDGSKNAYVTGQTNSTNFPTANPTQANIGGGKDAFVTQIAPGGASLVFSTYLGGPQDENVPTGGTATGAIAVDSAGANIYVAGVTASTTFPVTGHAEQTTYGGGTADAFVVKYATAGTSTGSFSIANGALSNTSGAPGVLASATITVTSTGGFNSAVTLACAVTPAVTNGPTCGFSGNPVTPPANGSGTATLNVATTAATARLDPPTNGHSGMLYAMILPVFGLSLIGAGFGPSGSRRRKLFGFILLGMVLAGLLILPACSSSSSGGGGGGGGGTPPNTYTITVTGSGGGATATATPALTLTVN